MRRQPLWIFIFVFSLLVPSVALAPAARAAEVAQEGLVSSLPTANTPHVLDGIVFSIAEVGDMIVLGGSFTQVQAVSGGPILSRNRVVAFNKNTGQISSTFAPNVNNTVRSVVAAPDGQSVYIGGQYSQVDGSSATKVVRLRLSDGGRVTSFSPPMINALIHDMKLVNNRLFIAGEFTRIGNQDRNSLAELDPATGALRAGVNFTFTGTHRGGSTHVHKFDVDSAGTTMVVTGNFREIDGQPRVQVGMIDLTPNGASLADWHTHRWVPNCYASFDYYLNDLDFAPDGSYFVLGSMGGYGSGPPSLCDTVSRWETSERGTNIDPTWANYTGGDSVYALEATGEVVYYGGHSRWVNNPFAADRVGPGAVDREGIGALNPDNGMPLTWNPGRNRGRGVFDMLATDDGLWVGSDTDRIGRYLYRGRIAFFPLAGGSSIPRPEAPSLPVDVIQTGSSLDMDNRYLYRINTGGPTIPAVDSGPSWVNDINPPGSTYRNTGNAATYTTIPALAPGVPNTTPIEVYSSERWDPPAAPEMRWSFPVEVGKNVEVRLYLGNSCDCTSTAGSRTYDVSIDGDLVLDNLDLVATYGHRVGGMESFDIVSDGVVDIDFGHVTENPLVNAIEIVDLDAPPPAGGEDLTRQIYFDGESAGPAQQFTVPGVPWDDVRGGFVGDDALYLALSNGTLTRRSFDGQTAGPATTLDLYGLTSFASEMQAMTGMFYTNGRIYFTLSGQSALYMRYFEVESGIVGAERYVHSTNLPGMSWNSVRGMFLAGDGLYWAADDGNLHRLNWTADVGDGSVSGPSELVSGPEIDGAHWTGRSLIAMQGEQAPPPNRAPVASFVEDCTWLTCTLDATGSSDPDGEIVDYAWQFAGTSASGAVQTIDFPTAGDHEVTLTVTDDDGATSSVTRTITTEDPPPNVEPVASFVEDCTWLTCTLDASDSSDPDGEIVDYAWQFAGTTATGAVQTVTFPEAGDHEVTLTVTDDDGASSSTSRLITVEDPPPVEPSDLTFVDSSSSSTTGSAMIHSTTVPAQVEAGDMLVAVFAANSVLDQITPPTGWEQAAQTATNGMSGAVFTREATAADAGTSVSVQVPRFMRGNLVVSAYRGADLAGATIAMERETTNQATHVTPELPATPGDWVLSYWADKTASTTAWTAPTGVAVRQTGAGAGAGHLSWLLADSDGPTLLTTAGGLSATANSSTINAVMATLVITPATDGDDQE